MRNIRLILPLTVTTLFAVPQLASAKSQPNQPAGAGSGPSSSVPHLYGRTVVVDTVPTCNCTGGDASIQICHTEEVTVGVGGGSYTVSTGQSSSTCVSKTVATGKCLSFRYIFNCTPGFWGWNCELVRTESRETTTTCEV
ncbi:MAG TPA: hypothetical protein ENJ09_14355 [Planctomycetes bacterium]|nr:hypothetical protein [Planctomycetota bacterium]